MMQTWGLIFLVVLSAHLAYRASAENYLQFQNLGNYSTVSWSWSYSSIRLYTGTNLFPFGSTYHYKIYVSVDGFFSLGYYPRLSVVEDFPTTAEYSTSDAVVAPFAIDIGSYYGSVRYNTFSTYDYQTVTVSNFISLEQGVEFDGTWLLLADWYNVAPVSESSSTIRFQGALITDGTTSYAVFIYNCNNMYLSHAATIGWQQNSMVNRVHPLSGRRDANQIACLNQASSYNTVVSKISSVLACSGSQFGCFDGSGYCADIRCDGVSTCRDGSDEVACETLCSSNEFTCDNGQCLPSSYECDGINDCSDDNSDEDHCSTYCPSYSFQCNNGPCISSSLRCNGIDSCGDNSDEQDCPPCHSYEFDCDNVVCVDSSFHCDDYDDCGDNSDEAGCENNVGLIVGLSVPLGLMLFIPILCVSAACYCKAKTRRRIRTHVVATPRGNHEIIVVTSSNLTSQSSGFNPSSTDFHESSSEFPLEAPPLYSITPEPAEQGSSGYDPPPDYTFESPLLVSPDPPVSMAQVDPNRDPNSLTNTLTVPSASPAPGSAGYLSPTASPAPGSAGYLSPTASPAPGSAGYLSPTVYSESPEEDNPLVSDDREPLLQQ